MAPVDPLMVSHISNKEDNKDDDERETYTPSDRSFDLCLYKISRNSASDSRLIGIQPSTENNDDLSFELVAQGDVLCFFNLFYQPACLLIWYQDGVLPTNQSRVTSNGGG
jgi:hypothetical protein